MAKVTPKQVRTLLQDPRFPTLVRILTLVSPAATTAAPGTRADAGTLRAQAGHQPSILFPAQEAQSFYQTLYGTRPAGPLPLAEADPHTPPLGFALRCHHFSAALL